MRQFPQKFPPPPRVGPPSGPVRFTHGRAVNHDNQYAELDGRQVKMSPSLSTRIAIGAKQFGLREKIVHLYDVAMAMRDDATGLEVEYQYGEGMSIGAARALAARVVADPTVGYWPRPHVFKGHNQIYVTDPDYHEIFGLGGYYVASIDPRSRRAMSFAHDRTR